MYLGQAMGICPGLMNFQTFDTSGTPYKTAKKLSPSYYYLRELAAAASSPQRNQSRRQYCYKKLHKIIIDLSTQQKYAQNVKKSKSKMQYFFAIFTKFKISQINVNFSIPETNKTILNDLIMYYTLPCNSKVQLKLN